MSVIVAGKLMLKLGMREEFIEKSVPAILLARQNKACIDFSVSLDPIDANRVNIFEKWTTREALEQFRNTGPDNDISTLIDAVDINEYDVPYI